MTRNDDDYGVACVCLNTRLNINLSPVKVHQKWLQLIWKRGKWGGRKSCETEEWKYREWERIKIHDSLATPFSYSVHCILGAICWACFCWMVSFEHWRNSTFCEGARDSERENGERMANKISAKQRQPELHCGTWHRTQMVFARLSAPPKENLLFLHFMHSGLHSAPKLVENAFGFSREHAGAHTLQFASANQQHNDSANSTIPLTSSFRYYGCLDRALNACFHRST